LILHPEGFRGGDQTRPLAERLLSACCPQRSVQIAPIQEYQITQRGATGLSSRCRDLRVFRSVMEESHLLENEHPR
jgi:hypothetical protein